MEKTWQKRVRSYTQFVLVAALLALLLKSCVVEAFRIPSGSMENTLLAGDFILVNKFVYGRSLSYTIPFVDWELPGFRIPGFQSPAYNDVVVYEQRDASGRLQKYVKRCIALPGDTLVIRNTVVYLNGTEFPPPRSATIDVGAVSPDNIPNSLIFPPGSPFNEDNYGPIRIPRRGDSIHVNTGNLRTWRSLIEREGHILDAARGDVFIDGRKTSEYVIGRDYYFMMGDNRNNSLDSRFRGFIPAEDIIGKAMFVYWSIDRATGDVRWSRVSTIVR
ncbi:MAG: signal peptidase I [Bacteroidota bacterium]